MVNDGKVFFFDLLLLILELRWFVIIKIKFGVLLLGVFLDMVKVIVVREYLEIKEFVL